MEGIVMLVVVDDVAEIPAEQCELCEDCFCEGSTCDDGMCDTD